MRLYSRMAEDSDGPRRFQGSTFVTLSAKEYTLVWGG